jgi:RNA polymerase subunit RPABC4/transcription elongation factor Spt4
MYKCRTCEKALSENAVTCPNCGEPDPFYDKVIKEWKDKIFKENNVSTHIGKILGSTVAFILGLFAVINGNQWYDKLLGVGFLIGSIIYALVKYSDYKEYLEKCADVISKLEQSRKALEV